MTGDEARDDQGGVVWYNSIGTAAPAVPVLVGAHHTTHITRNVVFYCLLVKANNARFSRQLLFLFCGHFERSGVQATNSCSAPNSIYQTR